MPGEIENAAEDEDVRLLQLTGKGDREAFSRLYDRLSSVLFATALSVLNNRDAAEDLLQDVFLTIWVKAPLYDAERGRPLAWAVTLTRNKAIDRLHSSQRRHRLRDDLAREGITSVRFDDRDSLSAIIRNDRSNLVSEARQQLSAEQRQAIEMMYFGSLTHNEVAERLNEPLGTIKARIRRGLLRLKELVADRL